MDETPQSTPPQPSQQSQGQPEPQPQSSPTASPRIPRFAIIAGVVILIVVIGIGGYLLISNDTQTEKNQAQNVQTSQLSPTVTEPSPTPDQIITEMDWETVTNKTYNYSVIYPALYAFNDVYSPKSSLFQVIETDETQPGFYADLYVSVIPLGAVKDDTSTYHFLPQEIIDKLYAAKAGDFIETNNVATKRNYGTFKKLPDTTIDGITAIMVENENAWQEIGAVESTRERRVFVVKGTNTFELGGFYSREHELNIFNHFLKNFKFL